MKNNDPTYNKLKERIAHLENENKLLKESLNAGAFDSKSEPESFLSQIINSTNDLIFSVDIVHFGLITFNTGLSNYFKKEGIELKKGMRIEDLYRSQEMINTWQGFYNRALLENSFSTEYSPSRSNRILLLNFHLQDTDGLVSGISVFGKDITEQKQAEIQLKTSKYFAENLIQAANVIIIRLNNDGLITKINHTAEIITGYSSQELKNKNWFEILVPKNKYPLVWDEFNRLQKDGMPKNFENPILTKSGEERFILWQNNSIIENGKNTGSISFGTDITEKKQYEKILKSKNEYLEKMAHDLEMSEKKYRHLVENSPIGIFQRNIDGTYNYCNPATYKYFECNSLDEFLSKYNDITKRWANTEKIVDFNKLLLENNEVYGFEVKSKLRSGKIKWQSLYAFLEESKTEINGFSLDITQRKEAEEALLKNEAHLNALIDTIPDLVWLKDENGVYLQCNHRFEQFFGAPKHEIIGKTDYDFVNKDLADFFREKDKKAIAVKIPTINEELVPFASDGHSEILETIKTPVYIGDGQLLGVLGIGRNITERKQAEEKLWESQRKLVTLMGNLPGLAYRCENDAEWSMIFMSEGCLELTGYYPQELEYNKLNSYANLIHPDDKPLVWQTVQDALNNNSFWQIEYRITTKKGKEKWVWEQGCGIFNFAGDLEVLEGFVSDITERKKAENELKENKRFVELIAEQTPDIIYVYNIAENKNIFINKNLRGFLNYKKGDVPEESVKLIELLIHPDDLELFYDYQDFVENWNREYIHEYEYRLKDANGKWRWFYGREKEFQRENDKIISLIGIVGDITERKQAEKELLEAKEKAEANEKRFELAVNGSNDGIWDWNLLTDEVYYSPRWKKQIGFKDNEVPNLFSTFENQLHFDDKSLVLSYIASYLKNEIEKFEIEFRLQHKDGNYRWIRSRGEALRDENGKPYRMCGSHTDITERKWQEEVLIAKTALLEAQTNSSLDGILVIDPNQKRILVNQKIVDLFKVPKHIMQNEDDSELLNHVVSLTKYPEQFIKKVKYLYNHPNEISRDEIEFKNGMVLDRYTGPVLTNNGKNYGRIWTFRDITERKQAERVLYDIIDKNPMSIQIVNKDGYTIKVNSAHTKLFGAVPPSDYSIFTDFQLKQQGFEQLLEDVKKGAVVNFPDIYYNAHELVPEFPNNPVWIHMVIFPLLDSNGNPEQFVIMHENITARRLAERIFLDIVDKNPMSIQIVDKDGYTMKVNSAHTQLFGAVPPADYSIFNDTQIKQQGYTELLETVKNGETVKFPDLYYNVHDIIPEHPDNPVWIRTFAFPLLDNEGNPERFVLMHENITASRQAEQNLKESEERYRGLYESMTDAYVMVDMSGSIKEFNQAYSQMLGYEKDELLQLNYTEITPDKWHSIEANIVEKQILINGYSEIYEKEYRKKDGNTIPVELRSYLMRDKTGQPIAMWAIVRDISQRKQTEKELEEYRNHLEDLVITRTKELMVAKEAAETANQSKSEFLSNMSHELRTPLNAILGFSKLLRYQKNITDTQKNQLTTVYQCGEHLLSLINDILDMSKIEAQKLELSISTVNLSEILHTVFNINKVKADEKDLEFVLEKNVSLPKYVVGDERKLKQIMLNLINNAIKFTEEGRVTVRVDFIEQQSKLIFEVKDTGNGIPIEKQKEIFEPFMQHTGKKLFAEGTGLGLSITKKLIEMMGGTISLQSVINSGSIFCAEIPLQKTDQMDDDTQNLDIEFIGYEGERKKILIVDDNHTNLSLLVSILEPLGFIVQTAENGQIALHKLRHFLPDLILLDYRMPVMDGIEFALKMNQVSEFKSIKTIGISATLRQKELKKQFHDLCNDFIPKPVNADLLLEKMKEILQINWLLKEKDINEEKNENIDLLMPDNNVIIKIIEYAEIGDFNTINEILDELAITNIAFEKFCNMVKKHAKNYDRKGIMQFLEK